MNKTVFEIKGKKIAYMFIILVCIFFVLKVRRGFTASSNVGGIWNLIQIFFVISGFFILLANNYKKFKFPIPICYFALYSFFAIVNTAFMIRIISIDMIFSYFMIPYGCMTLIVFFYVGTRLALKDTTILLKVTFYVIAGIVVYKMLLFLASYTSKGAVADSYYVLGLLPLLLIYTNNKVRILPITVTFIAVLLTGKRAGLLALIASLLFYHLVIIAQARNLKSITKSIIFSVISLVVLYLIVTYVIEKFNLNIIYRLQRLSVDGGSGRSIRWSYIWNEILTARLNKIIFGHGIRSVYKNFGGHAHNDFLQVLYEYGILAFAFYVAFYISLVLISFRMYKENYQYTAMFVMSIIISLFLASFSFFVIDSTYITCSSLTWGLILSDWLKLKNNVASYNDC